MSSMFRKTYFILLKIILLFFAENVKLKKRSDGYVFNYFGSRN